MSKRKNVLQEGETDLALLFRRLARVAVVSVVCDGDLDFTIIRALCAGTLRAEEYTHIYEDGAYWM